MQETKRSNVLNSVSRRQSPLGPITEEMQSAQNSTEQLPLVEQMNQRQYHMPLQMHYPASVKMTGVGISSQSTSANLQENTKSKTTSLQNSLTDSRQQSNPQLQLQQPALIRPDAYNQTETIHEIEVPEITFEGGDRMQQRSTSEQPQRQDGPSASSLSHNHPLSVYFKSSNRQGPPTNQGEEANDVTSLSFGRQSITEMRNFDSSPGELPRQSNQTTSTKHQPQAEPGQHELNMRRGQLVSTEIHRGNHQMSLPFQRSIATTAEMNQRSVQEQMPAAIHASMLRPNTDSAPTQNANLNQSRPSSNIDRRSLLEPDHNEKYSGANQSLFGSIQQSPTNVSQRLAGEQRESQKQLQIQQQQVLQRDEPILMMNAENSQQVPAQTIGSIYRPNMTHTSPDLPKGSTKEMMDFMQGLPNSSVGDERQFRSSDTHLTNPLMQNAASSMSGLDNQDYAFLTGVREVDDDVDTLKSNGQSSKIKADNQRSMTEKRPRDEYATLGSDKYNGEQYKRRQSEMKKSRSSSGGRGGLSTPKVQKHGSANEKGEVLSMYDSGGRVKPNPSEQYYHQSASNPFIRNLQQQNLWSSNKSRKSADHQISFGAGGQAQHNTVPPVNESAGRREIKQNSQQLSRNESSEQPDQYQSSHHGEISQNQNYLNIFAHQRGPSDATELLSRSFFKKQLAHMGEKACMRMTLKEMLLLLDSVNQKICKQSVQQEMMLNTEQTVGQSQDNNRLTLGLDSIQGGRERPRTPEDQIRFIMDMIVSCGANKSGDESMMDPEEEAHLEEKLHDLRNKSNLQLMEAIRMDAKMMNLRYNDILQKENNIYLMLAKEREKNQMLQQELKRIEAQSQEDELQKAEQRPSPPKPEQKTVLFTEYTSGLKNEPEMTKTQSNYTDQMPHHTDPVSKNESFTQQNLSISRDFLARLDEKDKEISALSQYIDKLKDEYQMLKITSDKSIDLLKKDLQEHRESQKQLPREVSEQRSRKLSPVNEKWVSRLSASLSPQKNTQIQQLQEQNVQFQQANQRLQEQLDVAKKQTDRMMSDLVKTNDINLKLNENLKKLKEKQQNQDLQNAQLKVLSKDQSHQSKINGEALEKAGTVIQKLNDDLQKSLEAAGVIQSENQALKNDLHHSRLQIGFMEQKLREGEKDMQTKIGQIDGQLNTQVQDLKNALCSFQEETREEKAKLHDQIFKLEKQAKQQQEEKKQMQLGYEADIDKLTNRLKDKEVEALDARDKILSLRLEMAHLQKQLDEDMAVKEELHRKEIEHMKRKLAEGSRSTFKTAPTETNRFFANENISTQRTTSRPMKGKSPERDFAYKSFKVKDGTPSYAFGGAYYNILNEEFQKIADEIVKVREFLQGKDLKNVQSFVAKYLDDFDVFKVKVLDALIDWHRKSDDLAKVATKHYETMENYKLMFVQMKQLVKQKDELLRRMQEMNRQSRERGQIEVSEMSKELAQTNFNTLQQCRVITESMQHRLQTKHTECLDLINYQNEFREEFKRLYGDREGLAHNFQAADTELRSALNSLDQMRGEYYDFKRQLAAKLEIEEDNTNYDSIPAQVEQLVAKNRIMTAENLYQKKQIDELTAKCDQQKETFQRKITDMEIQVEETQRQYMRQQDEAQDMYQMKEQDMERKIEALTKELDQATQEVSVRDRQIKKTEQKVEAEVQLQDELKDQIKKLNEEKKEIELRESDLKEKYEAQEKNFKVMEERFDHKVIKVDELEEQLMKSEQRAQRLELDLQGANEILKLRTQSLDDLNKEIITFRDQKEVDKIALSQANEASRAIETKLQAAKAAEAAAKNSEKEAKEKRQRAEDRLLKEERLRKQLEQDVRRYQDSLNYMSREADETKLKHLDFQILQEEKERLYEELSNKDEQIMAMRKQFIDKKRHDAGVQTKESSFEEVERLKEQVFILDDRLRMSVYDYRQIKDAMDRQLMDMDRIIEEKRQLEKEVGDKAQMIAKLQSGAGLQSMRNRSSSPTVSKPYEQQTSASAAKPRGPTTVLEQKLEVQNRVLLEKDNYISKLETEINEIRVENEKLKDKLIVFELDNMGTTTATTVHLRNANPHFKSSNSYNQYNATNNFTNTNINDRTMADSRVSVNQNTHLITGHLGAFNQLENSFGNGTGSVYQPYQANNNHSLPNNQITYMTRPDSKLLSHEYSMQKVHPAQQPMNMMPLAAPTILTNPSAYHD